MKDGPCRLHTAEASAITQSQKKEVLQLISQGTYSVTAAARKVGKHPATIWRWTQEDPDFGEAYRGAIELSDAVRAQLVEDTLFRRIIEGEASAAETIFFLKNRAPDRWHDRREIQVDEPPVLIFPSLEEYARSQGIELPELPPPVGHRDAPVIEADFTTEDDDEGESAPIEIDASLPGEEDLKRLSHQSASGPFGPDVLGPGRAGG